MYSRRNELALLMEEEEGGTSARGVGGWAAWSQLRKSAPMALPAPSPRTAAAMGDSVVQGGDESASPTGPGSTALEELIRLLTEERRQILANEKFTAKEKLALLDDNRKAIVVANGGVVRRTENVVYGLLIFGSVGLIVLALLTTYAGLPHEVTLSFVGTVLGGTIATIAQKLGNL